MITKRPKLFIFVLILGLLLTACQPAATEDVTPENTPVSEDAGTEPEQEEAAPAMPVDGDSISADIVLDPGLATDDASMLVSSYLFETLVTADGGRLLATGWTVSDDELDYIFELESGISFHDGTPFNADAVVANFNRWFSGDADYASWIETFGGFQGELDADGNPTSSYDGIEKVDEFTVLIHLNEPVPNLLDALGTPAFAMSSPASTDNASAAGTGAYHISSWTDEGFTLSPFDGYWGSPASGGDMQFKFE